MGIGLGCPHFWSSFASGYRVAMDESLKKTGIQETSTLSDLLGLKAGFMYNRWRPESGGENGIIRSIVEEGK